MLPAAPVPTPTMPAEMREREVSLLPVALAVADIAITPSDLIDIVADAKEKSPPPARYRAFPKILADASILPITVPALFCHSCKLVLLCPAPAFTVSVVAPPLLSKTCAVDVGFVFDGPRPT